MATARRLGPGRLAQEAAALAAVVQGSVGPRGGHVLLTRPTGEVLLSRDGRRVLEALNVESPTARMMISCISTHCNLTGDGAKTFIIILSVLLQELEQLVKGGSPSCYEKIQGRENCKEKIYRLKHVSQLLIMIQMDILDYIVTRDLEKHFHSVFSVSDEEISMSTIGLVLEAYFSGKVGINRQKFLSQLSCDFYFRVTAGKNRSEVLCFVDDCFAELHTTVTGLPVSSSRILDGLILHRDFAVYCPADGDKRVLVITEPIQPAYSDLGAEVVVTAENQHGASKTWITKRTEAVLKHMQDNDIKVILSSVKQQEAVHNYAKSSGISIVECLSPEEISLIYRITNISPFKPSLDNIHTEITEAAVAKFCQPLYLGTKRFVHIGFERTCALQLHCVILCGPVHGVTEQHVCAFHGAFKMLRQMFTVVCLTEQNLSETLHNSQQCSDAQQHFVEKHTDCGEVHACAKQPRPCGFEMEEDSVVSASSVDRELACSSIHLPNSGVDLAHDAMCSELRECERDLVDVQKVSQKRSHPKGMLRMDGNESLAKNQLAPTRAERSISSRNVLVHPQPTEDSCTRQGRGVKEADNIRSHIQSNSSSYLKEGSVLPVGGIFEILLHYYLSCYAKRCQSANVSILCAVIADALLSVPKTLSRAQKRDAFPQLYLEVTSAVRNNRPLLPNQERLESVSCKYQLVASILQCAARLLSIDLIVGIKRLPQKTEESDSEADL
ncbi:Bardet-Biedl syndrome 10 protein [Podarcis lilfordi]|uniref:60 kDa heat shock protein, mitochondrial n=2 Tax=Podarcis lilfordi TaxID=74358 RepID=A0AA35KIW3_9SAUR|nr:Bardet-Biedl syndrome 10 protein [Podarcis lilfordi]